MKLKTINDLNCSMEQIGDEGALEFENTFQSIKETFKQIKENNLEDSRNVFYVEYEELRQAAKEWIKKLEKERKKELDIYQKTLTSESFIIIKDKINYGFRSNIRWVKHFFNLDSKEEAESK